MAVTYKYHLGPGAYPDRRYTEVFGSPYGSFGGLNEALRGLLGGMPFPAAYTGRHEDVFVHGVSLEGVPGEEVIQVWTNEPSAVARTAKWRREHRAWLERESHHFVWPGHMGNGETSGLAAEIHVRDIAKWRQRSIAGLLGAGGGNAAAPSPLALMLSEASSDGQAGARALIVRERMTLAQRRWELERTEGSLRERVRLLQRNAALADVYLNGAIGVEHLCRGDRAPRELPYVLFQKREYIDEEFGLLCNFADMDWRNLAAVDRWMLETAAWRKLLPHPKTILVTRVRRTEKRYENSGASALEKAFWNAMNMEHLVWIRDGDNVWRFGTKAPFNEKLFVGVDETSALLHKLQTAVWKSGYAPARDERCSPEKIGALVADAANVEAPYRERRTSDITYPTLEEFMASEHYSADLDRYLHRRAAMAVREANLNTMPLLLLLQGIVDHRDLLAIPAGTDLLDPEKFGPYLKLSYVHDATLTDPKLSNQFLAHTRPAGLKPGDLVVAFEHRPSISSYTGVNRPKEGNRDRPYLYRVDRVENGKVFVVDRVPSKRPRYDRELGKTDHYTKQFQAYELTDVFIPVSLPVSLAEALLEDRFWKQEHRWAVPLLANWDRLKRQATKAVAPCPLSLGKGYE